MINNRQPIRVSKDSRREANEQLHILEKDVANYQGRCLFVVDDSGRFCDEPVSNDCHVISESAVLSKLQDKDQRVLKLEWGVSQWRQYVFSSDVDPTTVPLPRRPTGDVCIGWFACKPDSHAGHDNDFQRIDVAIPDFNDPEIQLLSAHRLTLFQADQYRAAIYLHSQRSLNREERRNREFFDSWQGAQLMLEEGRSKAESTAVLLGRNWLARKTPRMFDTGLVSARVLNFRSRLQFAGCVFYGHATLISVYPTKDDWHQMALLYLSSESDMAEEEVEGLASVAKATEGSIDYGANVAIDLIRHGWGALAASPVSYDGLTDADRAAIRRGVAKDAQIPQVRKPAGRHADRGRPWLR